MKLAHVRVRHAPAGSPWRLRAAVPGTEERRWLDLDVARRRLVRAQPSWRTTIRSSASRSPRWTPCSARAAELPGSKACLPSIRLTRTSSSKRPTSGSARRSCVRPASATSMHSKATFARSGSAAARRSRGLVPPPRLLLQQLVRGPRPRRSRLAAARPATSSTTSWRWRPSSTRLPATCQRTAPRRRSAASRSSTTGRPATCSATRPPSGWVPPRARTSRAASGLGWSRRTSSRTPSRPGAPGLTS